MEQKLHQVVRDQQHEAQSVKAVWAGHREGQQSNDSNEGNSEYDFFLKKRKKSPTDSTYIAFYKNMPFSSVPHITFFLDQ